MITVYNEALRHHIQDFKSEIETCDQLYPTVSAPDFLNMIFSYGDFACHKANTIKRIPRLISCVT